MRRRRRRCPVRADDDAALARGAGPEDGGPARQRPVVDEVREDVRARAQTAWGELAWLARAVAGGAELADAPPPKTDDMAQL